MYFSKHIAQDSQTMAIIEQLVEVGTEKSCKWVTPENRKH